MIMERQLRVLFFPFQYPISSGGWIRTNVYGVWAHQGSTPLPRKANDGIRTRITSLEGWSLSHQTTSASYKDVLTSEAPGGTRTHNLLSTNQLRYQLRHKSISWIMISYFIIARTERLRFELRRRIPPVTSGFQDHCLTSQAYRSIYERNCMWKNKMGCSLLGLMALLMHPGLPTTLFTTYCFSTCYKKSSMVIMIGWNHKRP